MVVVWVDGMFHGGIRDAVDGMFGDVGKDMPEIALWV
jgi:hypothetical protein